MKWWHDHLRTLLDHMADDVAYVHNGQWPMIIDRQNYNCIDCIGQQYCASTWISNAARHWDHAGHPNSPIVVHCEPQWRTLCEHLLSALKSIDSSGVCDRNVPMLVGRSCVPCIWRTDVDTTWKHDQTKSKQLRPGVWSTAHERR